MRIHQYGRYIGHHSNTDLNRIHCTRSCIALQKNLWINTSNSTEKKRETERKEMETKGKIVWEKRQINTNISNTHCNTHWIKERNNSDSMLFIPIKCILHPMNCRLFYIWINHKTNRTFVLVVSTELNMCAKCLSIFISWFSFMHYYCLLFACSIKSSYRQVLGNGDWKRNKCSDQTEYRSNN